MSTLFIQGGTPISKSRSVIFTTKILSSEGWPTEITMASLTRLSILLTLLLAYVYADAAADAEADPEAFADPEADPAACCRRVGKRITV